MRLATLVLLAACKPDPLDTGTPPTPPWLVDADEDAYPSDVDCDDADPDAHPGASEVCDGRDQDCDGEVDEDAVDAPRWYTDADGDGVGNTYAYVAACEPVPDTLTTGGDCDDADPAVHPGATEVCNGADDDCDDAIDEDAVDPVPFYADLDGDGHGAPGVAVIACAPPDAYVADATDCDDADPAVHPGAAEVCNGADDDCDDAIDEDAVDAYVFYADLDDDSYGDAGVTMVACRGTDGWIARLGDCDDTDPTVSPRGEETCDGVDEDCDGEIDEDAVDAEPWYLDADGDGYGAPDSTFRACGEPADGADNPRDCDDTDPTVTLRHWYADLDGDGFGDPSRGRSVCEAPAGYVSDATDCADDAASTYPGAVDICGNDADEDCDGADLTCALDGEVAVDDVYVTRVTGADDRYVGYSLAYAGDVDGDGIGDFVVGVATSHEAWLFAGGVTGHLQEEDAAATVSGARGEYLGSSVAGVGDLDGDGLDEVAVGAEWASGGAGRVYVLGGGWTGPTDHGAAAWTFSGESATAGEAAGDFAGHSVAGAGDLDGDGLPDLAVGAHRGEGDAADAGRVYVVLGGRSRGAWDLADMDGVFVGATTWSATGSAVAGVGDVDGDGRDDLLVGGNLDATAGTAAGAAWLLLGPADGTRSPADADATFLAEGVGSTAGGHVAGAGDTDGDGRPELLVGAESDDTLFSEAGAAYLLRGPFGGSSSLGDAAVVFRGDATSDYLGPVAGVGDLDRDGFDDIAVGAPYNDAGAEDGGAVRVRYGGDEDRSAWLVGDTYDGVGVSLPARAPGAPSDLTGDGVPDLLMGTMDGGASRGAVVLVPGGVH